MANTSDFIGSVNNMLDVVDRAVGSGDYSHLSRDLKDAAKPFTDVLNGGVNWDDQEFVRRNAQNAARRQRYSSASQMDGVGSRSYNGGHMSGRGNAFYGNYRAGSRQEAHSYNPESYVRSQNAQMRRQARAAAEAENAYFAPVTGSISATARKIIGGIMAAWFGVLTAGLAVIAAQGGGAPAVVFMILMGLFTAGFGRMFLMGRKKAKKISHFSNYRAVLERNKYANVKELARSVAQPADKTAEELQAMTDEGLFKQGHFDEAKTTFMASDEVYSQYLASEQNARELRRQERAERKKSSEIPPEVREVLEKGEDYIRQIREANDAIPDPEVTEKLSDMEKIVARIFDEVGKNYGLAGRLSMFMDYYLPTTMKLLAAYRKLDAQEVQGENIKNAKLEIEGSLSTINEAFEKLLDSFFADTAMDVSTDISVMRSMLKQDGLADDSFTTMRRKQGLGDIALDPTLKDKEEAYMGKKKEAGTPAAAKKETEKAADPPKPASMVYGADPEIEPETDPEMDDEEDGIRLVFGG
ncbi:MAG: 5-bromo-4-chloroindolyl phosphate hydrolysis family protein [Lachnospiraceae bacterium]|nr:5-bromo-4-chloroindolyl phosphate hydrolysis family protein [Lachnospiraceae bacterium]